MLFLDNKLTMLSKEYQKLDDEYSQLESEIEDLQSELDAVESKMSHVENQIKQVKAKLLEKKIHEINVFTDDPFVNDFIRASYFALKHADGGRQHFQYINITETELQATDSHRLIIIKCPHIPGELKNTKIKWGVRDNFNDHIVADVNYPDVYSAVPSKENARVYPKVNPKDFYSAFKPAPHGHCCVKIDFGGMEIGLNREYLDTALMVMDGEFDLYIRGDTQPLTFEGKDITVILMPVRLFSR